MPFPTWTAESIVVIYVVGDDIEIIIDCQQWLNTCPLN
jgi:hypothetical protein